MPLNVLSMFHNRIKNNVEGLNIHRKNKSIKKNQNYELKMFYFRMYYVSQVTDSMRMRKMLNAFSLKPYFLK